MPPRTFRFSVIEVMVTILLLTAIFVGIYSTQANLLRMNSLSGDRGEATALAQGKVEDLLSQPLAAVVSGSDTEGKYTRTWTVTSGAMAGTLDLDVVVKWYLSAAARTNQVRIISMRN